MVTDNIEQTQPSETNSIPSDPETPQPPKGQKPRKPRRWLVALLGIFFVLIFGIIGAWIGYNAAVRSRMNQQSSQVALVATTQFQLGLADLSTGALDNAKRRFEYVIAVDPKFPGAKDQLAAVMVKMAMLKTPTPQMTPTITPIPLTPTPDNRPLVDIYYQALQQVKNKDWDNAINTLDALRKTDKTFRAVDVDGLYYIALRNRGVNKILGGSLEPGMYDLALTELFGPMDKEGDSYRNWARAYVTGASFWAVDWQKVVELFGEIFPSLPNLRDGSGWTAAERFRLASMYYGDFLWKKGEYCMARDQYKNSLAVGVDAKLVPTATAAQLKCSPPTTTALPFTKTPSVTGTPSGETPVVPTQTLPAETATPAPPSPTQTSTPQPPTATP